MNAVAQPVPPAALVQAVQTNCDIADAHHAADLSLCNYLLQMREFFRWERGLPFGAPLARDEVGTWIARREQHWEQIASSDLVALPLPDGSAAADPFDVEAINRQLLPRGWLYGAGLAAGAPVFFLARCHALGQRAGLRVQQAGREVARGLAAPPAALAAGADGPIVLRRESLVRACWERYEAHGLRPAPDSAFAAVISAYGFDAGFHAALPRWLEDHTEIALLHELGEHRAGALLGARWSAVREALPTRRAALLAAALRDQLADLSVTLPSLIERDAAPSLHAWFAGYEGLRAALWPALTAAYRAWRAGDGGAALARAIDDGRQRFESFAQDLMALHDAGHDGAALARQLEALTPSSASQPAPVARPSTA